MNGHVEKVVEKYSNQCKKVTIQSIEINSADDESLTLMSDQIIPSGMQDSGNAENKFFNINTF